MVMPDYSLNAAPRPVGRSMNDPQRMQQIAMRRLRSEGNFQDAAALAQNQAWLDARLGGGRSPMMMPAMPPAPNQAPTLPAMPAIPGGRLVPGRSGGSMVWQPDAPPTRSMPSAPASSPAAMPSLPMPSMSPPAMPATAMPIVPPQLEGSNPLTGMPLNDRPPMLPFGTVGQGMQGFPGMAPPPPGLYGEAPPRFQEMKVGDMNLIVDSTTGKQVQSYKRPQPLSYEPVPGLNLLLPKGDGADRLPVLQQQGMIEAPRPEAAFMGPMPGKPKLAPYTPPTQPADSPKIPEGIQYEKDAMGKIIGGVYPTYNDQGKLVMRRIDLDGNGKVDPAEQAAAIQAAAATQGKSARGAMWSLVTP